MSDVVCVDLPLPLIAFEILLLLDLAAFLALIPQQASTMGNNDNVITTDQKV